MEAELTAILKSQERQKERVREELIRRATSHGRELLRLARKLTEEKDALINALGECQTQPHTIDRLCAVYMEKRDLIRELKGEPLI
jgi:hypothetical protein